MSVRALIKKFEVLGEKNAGRSGPNARRNSGRRNASRIHQESHQTAVPVAAAAAAAENDDDDDDDDDGELGKLLREEFDSSAELTLGKIICQHFCFSNLT